MPALYPKCTQRRILLFPCCFVWSYKSVDTASAPVPEGINVAGLVTHAHWNFCYHYCFCKQIWHSLSMNSRNCLWTICARRQQTRAQVSPCHTEWTFIQKAFLAISVLHSYCCEEIPEWRYQRKDAKILQGPSYKEYTRPCYYQAQTPARPQGLIINMVYNPLPLDIFCLSAPFVRNSSLCCLDTGYL